MKEEGIYVGLATGRGPAFVKPPFMERYGFDFAVTHNGQHILTKDRVLFTSPIDKKSLHQLIDYAREHRKEIASVPRMGYLVRIMSFGMSPISTWSSRFVPAKWPVPVSRGFNKVVSKVVPIRSGTPLCTSARTNLPSVDLIESRGDCKSEKSFHI